MAIYKVATIAVAAATDAGGTVVHQAFASSEGAAKKERRRLMEEHSLKMEQVTYGEIDMRPGKAGAIAYLNAFHAQQPGGYAAAGYPKAAGKAKRKK